MACIYKCKVKKRRKKMSETKKENKKNAEHLSDKKLDKVTGGKKVWIDPIKKEAQMQMVNDKS